MEKKINIGITFFWGDHYRNIWSNGAGQNMYFLKELLEQIDFVNEVYFVTWRLDTHNVPKGLEVDKMNVKVYDYQEVLDKTDLLIEGTLLLEEEFEKAFHSHGAKVISFRMGDDYTWDMTKFIRNEQGGRAFNNAQYDGVWLIPQVAKTNRSYVQVMKRVEADVVPHLWSPFFLENYVKEQGIEDSFRYQPCKGRKPGMRISVMEPNFEVSKTCYTPILVAEEAYHRDPEAIEHVYLCNTYHKRDLPVFHNFIGWTQLVKNGIMTVEERYNTIYFLKEYTDLVLSHQWELGLNYAYYEVLYADYPFVHNSTFLRDAKVGYYYPEFDAEAGATALLDAIHHHDEHLMDYKKRAAQFIETLSPYNQDNIDTYAGLITKVMDK